MIFLDEVLMMLQDRKDQASKQINIFDVIEEEEKKQIN